MDGQKEGRNERMNEGTKEGRKERGIDRNLDTRSQTLSNGNKNVVRHMSHVSVNLCCSHKKTNIRLASDLSAIYQDKLSATYHNNPELQLNIKSNSITS